MISDNLLLKAKEQAFTNPNPPGRSHVVCCASHRDTHWVGINKRKTHPEALKIFRNGEHGSCMHAEIDAIVKIPRDIRHKIKLFVMRFKKDGNLTMAKPCKMCQTFITNQGINTKNVYYTNWNGDWKRL